MEKGRKMVGFQRRYLKWHACSSDVLDNNRKDFFDMIGST